MTKKELGQLGWLNREIAAERKRLCELEAVLCGRGSAAGLPDLNGEELMLVREEIEASRKMIAARISRAAAEYNRLCRFIDSVEDSMMRQILSLRYINGLSWQQIAFSIGEHDEQYPRRKHQAFLAKQTKMTKSLLHTNMEEVRKNAHTGNRVDTAPAAGESALRKNVEKSQTVR